jgi:hypothetical protein
LAGSGVSHVFFIKSVLRRTLITLGDPRGKHILAPSVSSAGYMVDGDGRVVGCGDCSASP